MRTRWVLGAIVFTALASVVGCQCTLYPSHCGYDESAPPPRYACEGNVVVVTEKPCIDDSNKNDPPPSSVTRNDCTPSGDVCVLAGSSYAWCVHPCATTADCPSGQYCGASNAGQFCTGYFAEGQPCYTDPLAVECAPGLVCAEEKPDAAADASDDARDASDDGAADADADARDAAPTGRCGHDYVCRCQPP